MTNAKQQSNNYKIIIDKTIILCYNYYIIREDKKEKIKEIEMEKNFKTNNGEIKLECKDNSVKISERENFIKFSDTKVSFKAFENEIERFIKSDMECSAESLFDGLLNFYSVIAEHLGKIEVFCKRPVMTDYAEWIRAKEVKIKIEERTVIKTGEAVAYELGDKIKLLFDRKGAPINVETFGNISEEELKEGMGMIRKLLFSK